MGVASHCFVYFVYTSKQKIIGIGEYNTAPHKNCTALPQSLLDLLGN